jgi:zinc protease
LAAIKNEEDHMGFLAFRELRRKMYGNHPFARTRNGTKESVSALSEVTLQDFQASHVVGANAVVSIYGSVDSASLLGRLDATLGNLPRGERQIPHTPENLPESAGVICDLTKKDKRQAYLVTGFRTVDLKHPDRLALDLIDEACSDMASRLFIRIREEHGLAYSVGATQIIGMAPGAFVFHLSTAPEKLDFAQEQLLTEIALLAKDGLFADELDRARKTWIGKQAMQAQSNASLAEQHAIDELYGLGWQHHETVLDRVRSISLDEVNAAAQRYFGTLQPCIVRVKGEI